MSVKGSKTGVHGAVGAAWSTHGCLFYETKQDLLETLIPFFKGGLEHGESCLWIVSTPVSIQEAQQALRQAVPEFDRFLSEQRIELTSYESMRRVSDSLHEKLAKALARGLSGLRVGRNAGYLERQHGVSIPDFENELNKATATSPLTILCAYPIAESGAAELLEATNAHPVCATVRKGDWEFIETPALKEAKAAIKSLNQRLEQKLVEGSEVLYAANEELRAEIDERKRVENELRNQKEVLEKIFDHIPVMINFMGPGNQIKLVNREWERVLGWTLEELRRHKLDILSECYPEPGDLQRALDFMAGPTTE